jgi:hypothetical protein
VESSRLLGFIVSNYGIIVHPLKVEAIIELPPSNSVIQLQRLEGKENFSRCFVSNYAEITKGFMRLLKKGVPFIWDEQAQQYFDCLKQVLTSTPLHKPPNYNNFFILYLATSSTKIGMVLVQNDDQYNEHVIYYIRKGLVGVELRYPYVEKLALTVVYTVQIFRHYIFLRTTTVISDTNPLQYIFSCQILGGRYFKWIFLLQEFDLEFSTPKSKKSLTFTELMIDLPRAFDEYMVQDLLHDESLFLIDFSNTWYGDILIYLQTQCFWLNVSKDDRRRIHHQS